MRTTGHGDGAAVLLALGAGHEQVPAIEAGQRLGHHVVAVDPDPEAPGLAMADEAVVCAEGDDGCAIAIAAEHGVAALIPAPGEHWLPTAGRVNDALGLRGVSNASALACSDATRLHARCVAAGVRRPEQVAAGDAAGVLAAVEQVGRPCLLRPLSGGDEAVVVVGEDDDAAELVAWHLTARPGGGSVVEPVLAGRHVGVDGAVVRGTLELVGLRTRELAAPPLRAPLADLAPALLEDGVELAVRRELQRLVRALALSDCLFHATVSVADDELVTVLAAAACPAGGRLADALVPAVSGVAYLDDGIRLVLGEEVTFAPSRAERAPAAARRRLVPSGWRAAAGCPVPALAADPDVLCFVPPGRGDPGTVVTRGPDLAAAAGLAARVAAALEADTEPAGGVPLLAVTGSGTAAR